MASTLRRAQTLREIDRLSAEFDAWHKRRQDADNERKQYKTQLAAIAGEVTGALDAVRAQTENLGASNQPTGDLYDRLARIDRQIVWTRYAWDFFRARFDQRDDEVLRPALKAADEVTWSCFKPLFEKRDAERPPAPLPCIELEYAPSTLLSRHAHAMRRLGGDDLGPLKEFFKGLPVPLLRLPPSVVTSPWLLAVIAHEVGHAVYRYVESDGSFPAVFAQSVEKAAASAGADGQQWRAWSEEIFADMYAVLMVGPAAVWTLAHFDRGAETAMAQPRTAYPPALVRLLLIGRIAENADLAEHWALFAQLGLSVDTLQAPQDDRSAKIAAAIANLLTMPLATRKQKLMEAVDYRSTDFEPEANKVPRKPSDLERWEKALLGKQVRADETDLRTARLVAAATVRAALSIQAEDAAARKAAATKQDSEDLDRKLSAALASLGEASLKRIVACAERSVRAAPPPDKPATHPTLARCLLDATDDALFVRDDEHELRVPAP